MKQRNQRGRLYPLVSKLFNVNHKLNKLKKDVLADRSVLFLFYGDTTQF